MQYVSLPAPPNFKSSPPSVHICAPEQLPNKGKSSTLPEIDTEILERDYDLVEENYVSVDLRKIHSTFLSGTETKNNEPVQPIKSLHFLVHFAII